MYANLNPKPKIVIFDFVKSEEGKINYKIIECIKNGMLQSTKYESTVIYFERPHILVMSNFMPDV